MTDRGERLLDRAVSLAAGITNPRNRWCDGTRCKENKTIKVATQTPFSQDNEALSFIGQHNAIAYLLPGRYLHDHSLPGTQGDKQLW